MSYFTLTRSFDVPNSQLTAKLGVKIYDGFCLGDMQILPGGGGSIAIMDGLTSFSPPGEKSIYHNHGAWEALPLYIMM